MERKPITYRLNHNGSAASTYYPVISKFTDQVLAKAEPSIASIARDYRSYIRDFDLEIPRTVEEYIFELLNLGVLWKEYASRALSINLAPFRLLARMGEWRKHHLKLKPSIDVIRGIVMSLFLVPASKKINRPPHTIDELSRLVEWLEATGDFREDAFRYIRWLGFWGIQTRAKFLESMESITAFRDWFEVESLNSMGIFTPHVDSFVSEKSDFYKWREDRFSCLRSRVEYHLNMVGAEIMNRAFRKEFISSDQKTVLVPGCMRSRTAEKCEGTKTFDGVLCTGCESTCRINQLRQLGLRQNFQVCVLPHSTDLSRWAAKPGAPSSAVVGVACLSVLVQGGWELKRYNIPAQCVLLNECGCKKHWDRKGFSTELDVRELKRIMSTQSEMTSLELSAMPRTEVSKAEWN